jgi:hypothetical protein
LYFGFRLLGWRPLALHVLSHGPAAASMLQLVGWGLLVRCFFGDSSSDDELLAPVRG